MIQLNSVSKFYGKQIVIDQLDLTLPKGELTSIIGPNGAGKSTLLTMICRLISIDQGIILIDDMDIAKIKNDKLARHISVLRQENKITPRLTIKDLVSFGRYPHSKGRLTAKDQFHIDQAIHYLGLEELQHKFIDEISGGQRQRAFVAMVLCQDTDYIFLDEPLNSMDMKHAVAMMKLLRKIVIDFQKTIIIVLHDINFASCYSDRIIAMRHGKIVAQGPPQMVMQPECLRMIYEIDIDITFIKGHYIALYHIG